MTEIKNCLQLPPYLQAEDCLSFQIGDRELSPEERMEIQSKVLSAISEALSGRPADLVALAGDAIDIAGMDSGSLARLLIKLSLVEALSRFSHYMETSRGPVALPPQPRGLLRNLIEDDEFCERLSARIGFAPPLRLVRKDGLPAPDMLDAMSDGMRLQAALTACLDIITSPTMPLIPRERQLWADTSVDDRILVREFAAGRWEERWIVFVSTGQVITFGSRLRTLCLKGRKR